MNFNKEKASLILYYVSLLIVLATVLLNNSMSSLDWLVVFAWALMGSSRTLLSMKKIGYVKAKLKFGKEIK
jgi:hypothetical protein